MMIFNNFKQQMQEPYHGQQWELTQTFRKLIDRLNNHKHTYQKPNISKKIRQKSMELQRCRKSSAGFKFRQKVKTVSSWTSPGNATPSLHSMSGFIRSSQDEQIERKGVDSSRCRNEEGRYGSVALGRYGSDMVERKLKQYNRLLITRSYVLGKEADCNEKGTQVQTDVKSNKKGFNFVKREVNKIKNLKKDRQDHRKLLNFSNGWNKHEIQAKKYKGNGFQPWETDSHNDYF